MLGAIVDRWTTPLEQPFQPLVNDDAFDRQDDTHSKQRSTMTRRAGERMQRRNEHPNDPKVAHFGRGVRDPVGQGLSSECCPTLINELIESFERGGKRERHVDLRLVEHRQCSLAGVHLYFKILHRGQHGAIESCGLGEVDISLRRL